MATHQVLLGTTARAASRWLTEAFIDLMCAWRGESVAVFVSGALAAASTVLPDPWLAPPLLCVTTRADRLSI